MCQFSPTSAIRKLAFPLLFCLVLGSLASAQTSIPVNTTAQGPNVQNPTGLGDVNCSLGDAILTANSLSIGGSPVGGCQPAGVGLPYTIILSNAVYTLTSVHNYWYGPNALPPIATEIVFQGNGATLLIPATDGSGNAIKRLRFFFVGADPAAPATQNFASPGAGTLILQNLTLTGGRQKGGEGTQGYSGGGAGMGGAIFNQGTILLQNSTMSGNTATGGGTSGFGGGGGMGQDGDPYHAAGFGGALTSSTGGPFSAFSKGGQGIGSPNPYTGGGGGGFEVSDNGDPNGNGGGSPDGLGGQNTGVGAYAGHGSGGGVGRTFASLPGDGGDFGAGAAGEAGGGVGGGGGTYVKFDGSPSIGGSGGFGGGGAGGGGGGFGAGSGTGYDGAGTAGYGASGVNGGGAGMGGAIFNHAGSVTVLNSTLSGNSANGGVQADGLGGAIFNLNGAVTVSFSTLDANSVSGGNAGDSGGAIYASGGAIYSVGYNLQPNQTASLSISNSILADTVGGSDLTVDQPFTTASGGSNLAIATVAFTGANIVMSASYTGAAQNNVTGAPTSTASPQLGVLQLNAPGLTPTMAITTSSPAFQSATCDPNVTTDQRGVARPQPNAKACDIGSYELQLQTITFNSIPQQVVAAAVTLSATASSGLPVTFTSLTASVCSVSGTMASMLTVGTCTIQASQSGNGQYAPATSVSQNIQVVKASQTISLNAIPQQVVGAAVALSATASSGLPVTLTSLTTSVCTVSGTRASTLTVGTCSIQASQAGNGQYAAAPSVTQSFSVVPPSNFSMKPLPAAETVNRGILAAFLLELDSVNGFNGNVKLSCSGGPAGAVCADLPQTVKLNGRAYAVSGMLFPSSTKPGTYTIKFTGVSGSLTNSTTASFTVK